MPSHHGRHRVLVVLAATLALVGPLGACSSSGGDDDGAAKTTTTEASTTTTEATDTTGAAGPAIDIDWSGDAQDYRGQDGEQFTFRCDAGGEADTIWGVETYTDDSSVCTAAAQLGVITLEEGGDVTIEIAPGLDSYEGGVANEVESLPYGAWGGSFTFPDVEAGSVEFTAGRGSWRLNARDSSLEPGSTLEVTCSADGESGSVWGSDPYTADSSICTAAVHAGIITLADGGEVRIEVVAGEDTYTGTEANGITTNEYGSYDKSFTFPADQP